jgi:hypothetical protein
MFCFFPAKEHGAVMRTDHVQRVDWNGIFIVPTTESVRNNFNRTFVFYFVFGTSVDHFSDSLFFAYPVKPALTFCTERFAYFAKYG